MASTDRPLRLDHAIAGRFERFRRTHLVPRAERLARSDRGAWISRRVRWPLPGQEPYRRRALHVYRPSALGDVLLCTPALRRLKQVNPDCHVTVYTSYPGLLEGLPFIDAVRPSEETPWDSAISMRYEGSIPPDRHLARIMGDCLGLDVRDVRPSCALDPRLRDDYRERWRDLPRPWIAINRHSSAWTPNKNWPEPHWHELVDRLLGWATVIDIGNVTPSEWPRREGSYLSLIGQTPLDHLAAVLAAADLHAGPISGPAHLAAAFGCPSVVIYGGYESPSCTHYPGNIALGTEIACAPCWLRDPCPIGKTCLRDIPPARVEEALRSLWNAAEPAQKNQRPTRVALDRSRL